MKEPNNPIDLTDLIKLHRDKKLSLEDRMDIENIFFLCLNRDFLESVHKFRIFILNEQKIAKELPITDSEIMFNIKRDFFKSNKWDWYNNLLLKSFKQFNFYSNDFFPYHSFLSIQDEVKKWTRILSDKSYLEAYLTMSKVKTIEEYLKLTKAESLTDALKGQIVESMFTSNSYIENIVFLNNPLAGGLMFKKDGEMNSLMRTLAVKRIRNRKTATFAIKEDRFGPYVEARFSIYSSKKTMKDTVEENFEKMAQERFEKYGIQNRKEYPKKDIESLLLVNNLKSEGESLTKISVKLEKKNLRNVDKMGVKEISKRAKLEAERFTKRGTRKV